MHPGFCVDLCRSPFFALRADGDANNDPFDPLTFGDAFMLLTGPISLAVGNFLSDPHTESLLPPGTPRAREFAEDNFAVYVQDIWRLRSDLTLTLGLRYGYASPVWEQNGFQVRPTIDVGAWWSQRRRDMICLPGFPRTVPRSCLLI
jgi:outer membrane receptor protein involved in Fe transport